MSHPLYLNRPAALDWLIALEFGRVDDGQPADCWEGVSEQVGLLRDTPGGRIVGFKITDYSTYEPDSDEHDVLWREPRFSVPALG